MFTHLKIKRKNSQEIDSGGKVVVARVGTRVFIAAGVPGKWKPSKHSYGSRIKEKSPSRHSIVALVPTTSCVALNCGDWELETGGSESGSQESAGRRSQNQERLFMGSYQRCTLPVGRHEKSILVGTKHWLPCLSVRENPILGQIDSFLKMVGGLQKKAKTVCTFVKLYTCINVSPITADNLLESFCATLFKPSVSRLQIGLNYFWAPVEHR